MRRKIPHGERDGKRSPAMCLRWGACPLVSWTLDGTLIIGTALASGWQIIGAESEEARVRESGLRPIINFSVRGVNSLGVESPGLPLALIGFSFGAFVQSRVAKRLEEIGRPAQHVVLAAIPVGNVEGARTYNTGEVPPGTVIVHGELDERVPLNRVLQWAGLHPLPVVVDPAGNHFFKGRLPVLRDLVVRELSRD